MEPKAGRIHLHGTEATTKLDEGAKAIYDSVTPTFGARGTNVAIEKTYGKFVSTRDGVSVAKETYYPDRAKNIGAQFLNEASETTNRNAGDGTTATIALGYNLIVEGRKAIASGINPMVIKDTYTTDRQILLNALADLSVDVKDGQLEQVATVSCGDPLLGKLVSEAVEHVGLEGGIITEKVFTTEVEREYVDGYFIQKGFIALNEGKRQLLDTMVIVSAKHLTAGVDALELLNKIATSKEYEPGKVMRIAFFGEIEGEAYETILANMKNGYIDSIVVNTPPMGDMGTKYLEDIAIYTGAHIINAGNSIDDFTIENIGYAERIVASKYETTIFGGKHNKEDMERRVADLQDAIQAEEVPAIAEKYQDRLAKIQGRVAIFRIGGTTETEKEDKEYRLEDAIQATRAALEYGIVAGGGTTLLELSKHPGLSPSFAHALQATFKRLLDNAALPSEVMLKEALNTSYGMGYNLRAGDDLVDLAAAGILDPTLVVEQVITNASSAAAELLACNDVIIFESKEA